MVKFILNVYTINSTYNILTGKAGVIFNGIPDWTYENILELQGKSITFSPDNQYMAFITYNDSLVEDYT